MSDTCRKICLQIINKTYDFEALIKSELFNSTKARFMTSNNSAACHEIVQSQNSNNRTSTRIATAVSKPAESSHKQSKTTYNSESYF